MVLKFVSLFKIWASYDARALSINTKRWFSLWTFLQTFGDGAEMTTVQCGARLKKSWNFFTLILVLVRVYSVWNAHSTYDPWYLQSSVYQYPTQARRTFFSQNSFFIFKSLGTSRYNSITESLFCRRPECGYLVKLETYREYSCASCKTWLAGSNEAKNI